MQEKVKGILSFFLKIPAEQIIGSTIIDRSAVNSSILLHRMYAKLSADGMVVPNYQEVHTFSDLLQRLNGHADNTDMQLPVNTESGAADTVSILPGQANNTPGIGIDIEMVSAMPVTNDFREEAFYTMNFSAPEISYCILQPGVYASFAGLFAAKEAIVKADNRFKTIEFRNITIQHLIDGKPFHTGFNLSIAHTNEIAVAVAVPVRHSTPAVNGTGTPVRPVKNIPVTVWLLVLTSLLLSAIALFLAWKK